jgi:hypothetical protein
VGEQDRASATVVVADLGSDTVGDSDAVVSYLSSQPGETETTRWRVMVFADSEIFSDGVLYNVVQNRALLADAARWLGRDEAFAGTTESEEDVRIVHTRAEHVAWFFAIIAGAPLLVLAGGLGGVFVRRRSLGEI